jgi:hypothetical protein
VQPKSKEPLTQSDLLISSASLFDTTNLVAEGVMSANTILMTPIYSMMHGQHVMQADLSNGLPPQHACNMLDDKHGFGQISMPWQRPLNLPARTVRRNDVQAYGVVHIRA